LRTHWERIFPLFAGADPVFGFSARRFRG
jgi:hypothetical protein